MTTATTIGHHLVAEAFLSPSGRAPDGSAHEPVALPRVSGFVESTFSPLVRAVVERCVAGVTGGEPFGDEGARTALVLATTFGDAVTADLGSRLLASGQMQNPLLFYQSVPTTILGVVARDFGITGPTMCFSAQRDLRDEALDLVDVLLNDDEVDQVLLVAVDLEADVRARRVAEELVERGTRLPLARSDTAVAFLFRGAAPPHDRTRSGAVVEGDPGSGFGALSGLVELYLAALTARRSPERGALTVPLTTAWGPRRLTVLL
ncbi:ketosynthase [Saccharothrix sp. Mg75]|uniref:ketosynthase n=1 Tax=Saccharothrix sp. Mg75 TaxID=3445357 RepID=UPI003EE9E499